MIVQKVKIFMKDDYYFEGRFVSKDDKFVQFIDRKSGNLKIINLDEVRSVEFFEEEINDKDI